MKKKEYVEIYFNVLTLTEDCLKASYGADGIEDFGYDIWE